MYFQLAESYSFLFTDPYSYLILLAEIRVFLFQIHRRERICIKEVRDMHQLC